MNCRTLLVCLLFLFFGFSCTRHGQREKEQPLDSVNFRYASFIHVYKYPHCRLAVLDNPWHKGKSLHRYVLVSRDSTLPANLPEGTVLRTPLNNLTVGASVHCGLLSELGALSAVKGVCDSKYILSPVLRDCIRSKRILDMGLSQNPNVERLIAMHCDAILLSPYDRCSFGAVETTRIPIVECADYMETSPLGRAEWMKFYGMLVGREACADSLFDKVEKDYLKLKALARQTKTRPTLFVDLLTSSVWYQPGGKSTMGQLFRDAGAAYLWAENGQSGSLSLSFESVFKKAHDAQLWLIKYGAVQDLTYAALQKEQPGYVRFRAFGTRKVWGCNLFHVPFSETGAFHPERVLSDMVRIVHPETGTGKTLQYFQPLR